MGLTYDPIDTLKLVGPECWVVDGPAIRFYGMPFSTRMTVVRLADGAVWIHSPIRLTETLGATIRALGPVKALIAPNWIHYAYVNDWAKAFPQAGVWAAPGVVERAKSRGMTLRVDHGLDAADPWAGEIRTLLVKGSPVHREAVFFHRRSQTLILTDLIESFEPRRLPWWFAAVTRLAGIAHPTGKMPPDMRMTFRCGRADLRSAVETMIGWAPERVIVAHGRWFARDGVAELRRAFGFVLRE